MFAPVGARSASWSNVRHSPPAFTMRARTLREAQSAHLHRRNLHQTDVVGDRAHNHGDLALSALHVSSQRAQTHRRTVDSAHVEASQHHFGELGVRATSDEAVELRISENASATSYLDQKSEIDVVALGSLSGLVSALAASSNQINTLGRVRNGFIRQNWDGNNENNTIP